MLEIALQMRIYFFRDMMFTDNLMTLDEIFSETNMSSPGFSSHVAAGMETPLGFLAKGRRWLHRLFFWGARRNREDLVGIYPSDHFILHYLVGADLVAIF